MRQDLLRAMRLFFLIALLIVSAASIGHVASLGLSPAIVGTSCAVLVVMFGLRVVEYRRTRPVPAWIDAVELLGAFTVLVQTDNIDAVLGTFFFLVLFRAAVSNLTRLVPVLIGYSAVWLAAVVVHPQIRLYPGALVSLSVVGLLVYGMRELMLRLREQHRAQSALLDAVLRRLPFPVVVTDAAARVVLSNPAANALTGWSEDGPQSLSALKVHAADGSPVDLGAVAARAAGTGAGSAGMEMQLLRPDGSTAFVTVETVPMADEFGQRPGTVLALLDMTVQRRHEEHLHRAAFSDAMTGLANRALLWQRLDTIVRTGERYCVLLIDLDEFKAVNDTFGHQVGDELLQHMAKRLGAAAPAGATVARLGGDEFAVLLPDATSDEAELTAAAVRRSFEDPFDLSCGLLQARGTVGVAEAQPGQAPDAVIAAADRAMYTAKPRSRRQPPVRTAAGQQQVDRATV